ncbi:germin-like protein subfamily T member 2 [Papaver somniferum]|uniref:germin-like protein subfamily T member 2 n=1 Tax=Papaver somniferum TaxID=3469 RepID=UPI000E6FAED5|nr:germin-like protein subfamily T member 2 [Papaver somniferum]
MAAKISSISTASSFFLVLCLILVFTLPCFSDPDELQDFCVADLNARSTMLNGFPCKRVSEVTSDDFFYSGLMKEASTANLLGFGVRFGDVNNFPGVNTLGLSINRVDFAPGGNVPLHSHPRASEANFVLKGKVLVGFISGSNVLYSKVLKAGEMFIVPKGLVHFLKNVGTGKAVVIAAFNSQLPGAALLANSLFASNPTIPNDILAKNFQVDGNVIATIKSKFGNQTK